MKGGYRGTSIHPLSGAIVAGPACFAAVAAVGKSAFFNHDSIYSVGASPQNGQRFVSVEAVS